MMSIGTNRIIANSVINTKDCITTHKSMNKLMTNVHGNNFILIENNVNRKILEASKEKVSDVTEKQESNDAYLKIDVIKKIIIEIISKNKLSKDQLAAELQISTEELMSLMKGKSEHLIPKINLPLIKIYCKINSQ